MGVHALLEAVRASATRRATERPSASSRSPRTRSTARCRTGARARTTRSDPSSPYSAAKAAGEHLARAYHETYGLDVVITRGANTYGPRQHPEKLIPLFITNALTDLPLPMYGDGMQRRDWLYVDDHADGVGVVARPRRGRAAPTTCRARASSARTARSPRPSWPSWASPGRWCAACPTDPATIAATRSTGSRLRALGWAPRVPFEEGIRRTVRWYADNEAWWRAVRDGDWDDYYQRQYGWRLERSVAGMRPSRRASR